MDLAVASAGPWLVLGIVVGLLLAGGLVLAAVALRRSPKAGARLTEDGEPEQTPFSGWIEDDLPGFLDQPPGTLPDATTPSPGAAAEDPPLASPDPAAAPPHRRVPPHPATASTAAAAPDPARLLLALATVAVLLVGVASALAAMDTPTPSGTEAAGPSPTWDVPDLTALPDQPEPGDPGAGRLAARSVPIGDEGALARLTFEGLVLERRAVGVTAAYPSVSVTAARVPGGPALAHLRLPVWNCLTDTAPDDPVAAGCRRLPPEYADLPTPALTVAESGDGLRISGRFATYVRPSGSPPEWTGRVYPLTVHVQPDGDDATGTLHLGTERAAAVDDPLLSDLRRGR